MFVEGSSALTAKRFVLAVNRVVVLENITCPSNAVSLLFAMFYVLNLHYSENSAITLEFIQRFEWCCSIQLLAVPVIFERNLDFKTKKTLL